MKVPKEVHEAILESLLDPVDPEQCSFGPAYGMRKKAKQKAYEWFLAHTKPTMK